MLKKFLHSVVTNCDQLHLDYVRSHAYLLITHFLSIYELTFHSLETIEKLTSFTWPGNTYNLLEREGEINY